MFDVYQQLKFLYPKENTHMKQKMFLLLMPCLMPMMPANILRYHQMDWKPVVMRIHLKVCGVHFRYNLIQFTVCYFMLHIIIKILPVLIVINRCI